ncbi:hypothetical protein DAPPUDRAFT_114423 [Daphnia pulex]|uniref:Uncharacterized protein n=1 Tax=Daphnia pulex TaxID=6669 RepID=E9HI36_DAPPU|nr:hypothetical protein DAPPUDRAFT_114423 [Daphnia pulex]|eukprot:EFX68608.1 hypothetical protein DAPPUDRAFT_114423 [Daphnia pulex]
MFAHFVDLPLLLGGSHRVGGGLFGRQGRPFRVAGSLLEADREIEPRRKILQIQLDCLDDLNRLNRQQFDNNSDELWAIKAGAILKAFETQVVKVTKVEGYDGKEVDEAERQCWSVRGGQRIATLFHHRHHHHHRTKRTIVTNPTFRQKVLEKKEKLSSHSLSCSVEFARVDPRRFSDLFGFLGDTKCILFSTLNQSISQKVGDLIIRLMARQTDRRDDVIVTRLTRLKVVSDILIENREGVDETGQVVVATDL